MEENQKYDDNSLGIIDIQAKKEKIVKIYDERIPKNISKKNIILITLLFVLTVLLFSLLMHAVFSECNLLYFISSGLLITAYTISYKLIDLKKIKKDYSENNDKKYNAFINGLETSKINTQKQIKFYKDLFKMDNYIMNNHIMNNYIMMILKLLNISGLITLVLGFIEPKTIPYFFIWLLIVLIILIIFIVRYISKEQKKSNTILRYLRKRHFELKYKEAQQVTQE